MREDLAEQLDKMFPGGFLIVYPTKDGKEARVRFWVPNDDPASRKIYDIYRFLTDKPDSQGTQE